MSEDEYLDANERLARWESRLRKPTYFNDIPMLKSRLPIKDCKLSGSIQSYSLYIITTRELWPVKIGVSTNPTERLKQLQTSHWLELIIYRIYDCPGNSAFAVEANLHGKLSGQRIAREWFGLAANKAANEVEELLAKMEFERASKG